MRWQTSTSVALFAAQLFGVASAIADCRTVYASTSTSQVPTRTSTKTVDVTSTSTTLSTVYETTTTIRPTYISIVGNKTTTVPTGRSFTPLTSCPTQYITEGPLKSNAAAERVASTPKSSTLSKSTLKTTSYPKSVTCSTTITHSHTTTLTTDATITDMVWSTTISTSHVATSTAYAACGPKNVVHEFHGQNPVIGETYEFEPVTVCDYTPNYGTEGQIDCLSARTCCEGAQRNNYSGFQFYYYSGANHCFYFGAEWDFTIIDGVVSADVVGNGPSGSGIFQNITYTE